MDRNSASEIKETLAEYTDHELFPILLTRAGVRLQVVGDVLRAVRSYDIGTTLPALEILSKGAF